MGRRGSCLTSSGRKSSTFGLRVAITTQTNPPIVAMAKCQTSNRWWAQEGKEMTSGSYSNNSRGRRFLRLASASCKGFCANTSAHASSLRIRSNNSSSGDGISQCTSIRIRQWQPRCSIWRLRGPSPRPKNSCKSQSSSKFCQLWRPSNRLRRYSRLMTRTNSRIFLGQWPKGSISKNSLSRACWNRSQICPCQRIRRQAKSKKDSSSQTCKVHRKGK